MILLEKIEELPTEETAPSKVHVKIADFGIFGSNKGTVAERHNAGSVKYMAPEILKGDNASDPKIDIWSLGVMMYAMITGKYAFDGNSREQIKEAVINKEVSFAKEKRLLTKSIRSSVNGPLPAPMPQAT